jgi:Fur family ferric uptake transcriptional regulator
MNECLTDAEQETPLEQGLARIRSAGKRITQARVALIGHLLKQSKPVSTEEIYGELMKSTSCELMTVYRCLMALEELGMVRRDFSFEGTTLWYYVRESTAAYHVVSKDTAGSEPLDPELCELMARACAGVEEVLKARGYSEVTHRARFFARGLSLS